MMNQQDLLKKTGNILRELQEQYEMWMQSPQSLSELELELFHANANFLTEHIQILKKVASRVVVPALPEHTAVNPKESTPAINVYQDLFKPDVETPTFEFIVHDQLKQSTKPQEEPTAAELPPQEEEDIIAAQDETIIQESNPISEPVNPVPSSRPVYGSSNSEFGSQQHITSVQPDQEPADDLPYESAAEVEEDEIGPEPFLVTREPEFKSPDPELESPAAFLSPEAVVSPEPAQKPEPIVTPEPVVTPSPAILEPLVKPAAAATSTPAASQAPEPVKHQPTLNEMLASKSSVVNINTSESGKPVITDLKSAINLNEKLLFIKDLFDGYNLAYSEAIDLVNKMPDFEAADKFLQSNYAGKHQWSSKPATVEQLYGLLHQRFPK